MTTKFPDLFNTFQYGTYFMTYSIGQIWPWPCR